MANEAAIPPTANVGVGLATTPVTTAALSPPKAALPPGDSFAAGGPTAGQLFPLGTRLSSP